MTKGIFAIFLTTFSLVFVLLMMVEPYLECTGPEDAIIPDCRVTSFSGEFILGLLACASLFALDLGLVYLLISDLVLG